MNKWKKSTLNYKCKSPDTAPDTFLKKQFLKLKANEIVIAIFLVCFIIYNTYTSLRMSGDTFPAGYIPFSIIYYHNLFLEPFSTPDFVSNAYAFTPVDGHMMSLFPIVTPVLITPFVWLCTLGMTSGHAILHVTQIGRTASAGIAALAVCTFYLIVIRFAPRKIAVLSTLVFAFATSTWSISSQALWQHGMIELLLLLMIYIIVRNEEKTSSWSFICLGILSGLFVFCRPPDALLLIPILGYVIFWNRKYTLHYIIPAIFSGLPFLAYNWFFFGNVFGGYVQNLDKFSLSIDILSNYAGLFISPNKGLLIFSPILILAVFGYFQLGSLENKNISRLFQWFGPVLILETIMYSFFSDWGGGYSYGYRFLIALVPILCIYIALFLSDTMARFRVGIHGYLKAGAIATLILFSILVQFIGVFYFPYLDDVHYPRPWDSANPLILSSLNDGMENFDTFAVQSIPPFPPLYYYSRYDEWKYLDVKTALAAGDYATASWYYAQHLQANPDSSILWNNYGCCLMKLGEYEEALQSFDRSIAVNPEFKEAQSNRAAAEQILTQYNRTEAAGNTLLFGKMNPA